MFTFPRGSFYSGAAEMEIPESAAEDGPARELGKRRACWSSKPPDGDRAFQACAAE